MPKRIQRLRTRGWRMPENTLYVGRPSKWGNRHRVGYCGICKEIHTQQQAVNKFESELTTEQIKEIRKDLENKNPVCWCPLYDKNGLRVPCHADILLSLANDIPLEKICAPLTIQNSQKSDVLNAEK